MNGLQQSQTDTALSIAPTALPVNIGRNPQHTTRLFDGVIDDIRLYNRVLDSVEIDSLCRLNGWVPDTTPPPGPSIVKSSFDTLTVYNADTVVGLTCWMACGWMTRPCSFEEGMAFVWDSVDFGTGANRAFYTYAFGDTVDTATRYYVDLRLDSLTAPPYATIHLYGSGDWCTLRTDSADVISRPTGIHSVWLVPTYVGGRPSANGGTAYSVVHSDVNDPPHFTGNSAAMTSTAEVGSYYVDTTWAADSPGDLLQFSFWGVSGLIIADSIVGWFPGIADTGANTIYAMVEDGNGGSDTLSWTVQVSYPSGGVIHVDAGATGANTGVTWSNALGDLQTALTVAKSGHEIWVSRGVYRPTSGNERSVSFGLKQGVDIYGGFAGTETSRSQRNWVANPCTLSGDIGLAGTATDNSFHVVRTSGTCILDGFIIVAGQADSVGVEEDGGAVRQGAGLLTIANCVFANNVAYRFGGAIYTTGTSIVINSCVFDNNAAQTMNGGAIAAQWSTTDITNSVFVSNTAPGSQIGGAVLFDGAGGSVMNCTFYGNQAGVGGAIACWGSGTAPTITNSILWNNASGQLYVGNGAAPTVTYCDVDGAYTGTGNINSDPVFENSSDADGTDNMWFTSDDGFQLRSGSPCIDTSTAAGAPSTDILGDVRPQGDGVDMGAYESPFSATLGDGMVAYYPFTGNADDSTGNGNHGTVYGATLTADRFGNPNSAYDFDGSSDRIDMVSEETVLGANPDEFTVTLWMKPRTVVSTGTIITSSHNQLTTDQTFAIQLHTEGGNDLRYEARSGGSNYDVWLYDILYPGSWYFTAVTFSKSTGYARLHIDGIEAGNAPINPGMDYVDGGTIKIGANYHPDDYYTNFFNGVIDDIRIYSRALDSAEIDLLYHDGGWVGPPPAGMVLIPAEGSSFDMGQPNPNIGCVSCTQDEQPVHTVSFTQSFWMDTTEVTQYEYDSLMSATYPGHVPPNWELLPAGFGPDFPAYGVNWYKAALYCNARSKRDGRDTVYAYTSAMGGNDSLVDLTVDLSKEGYRLATEAEWEYACRAGSTGEHYWGTDTSLAVSYEWYGANSGGTSHPVATKSPNAFGIYDMQGNVGEWCNDFFGSTYYASSPSTDPSGPLTGVMCVLRGGHYGALDVASTLRSAARWSTKPSVGNNANGFRVVLPAE